MAISEKALGKLNASLKLQAMQRYRTKSSTMMPPIGSTEMLDYIDEKKAERFIYTVKFITLDNEVFTQSYAVITEIAEIKEFLEEVFDFPKENMQLSDTTGKIALDTHMLGEFECGPNNILDMFLVSTNPDRYISAKYVYRGFVVPDIITVTVTYEDGTMDEIVVEMENRMILKPFLGGYRHKITQIEYNHAYSQTGPMPPKVPNDQKNHRDTQTSFTRNRKLDTTYSRATQMQNSEIYIPSVTDKIVLAGPYETADEMAARLDIEGKVRIIQRYFRAWKLRKALKELCKEYHKRLRLEAEEEVTLLKMDADRKNRELIGKVFPRTKADFYMLYTMLENWKKAEIERIKKMTCGPSRLAEMYLLLEKEIDLLLSIERQKETVKRDQKVSKEIKFLKTISEPLAWNSDFRNLYIEMDTLETQKGREYYAVYEKLCNYHLPLEERLAVYADIKFSLKDHSNCEVGLEVVSLIDRMCAMIAKGITDCHLEVLQKRIQATYMKHLKMPDCCDGVSLRISRVDEKTMKDNLFFCERCKKFKTSKAFSINSAVTHTLKVCRSCMWSDRVMEPWLDIHPYRYLLKCIRREERRQSSHSSIAFIMREKDIHHIIVQIWQAHSSINQCDDIYKLRLCRFFRDCDWAPWNCILLTYEETKAHLKIRKLEDVYDQEFLHHVRNKHTLAKRYFKASIQLNEYFQDMGVLNSRWDEIIEKREFIAVNSKMKIFLSCH